MARSLITQLEQIRRSATYTDSVASVTTQAIAEPTVSGSLQDDLNIIRSLMRLNKGTSKWYTDLGTYFDPTNTNGSNVANKTLNLNNLKNNTLDAKTMIVPIVSDNSGAGYSVSGTQNGILVSITTPYATPVDRRGLPIFHSTAHAGSYWDEGGSLDVCAVDIVSVANNTSITTVSGYIVYGLLYDGSDYSGTGSGIDVYLKFFANGVAVGFPSGYETTTTTISGGYVPPSGDSVNFDFGGGYITPSGDLVNFDFNTYSTTGGIKIIYPHRRRMADLAEYEWFRTDFIKPVEGNAITSGDLRDLWSYLGTTDGGETTAGTWTHTTGNYAFKYNPATIKSAIDTLNTDIGDATYTQSNYIANGQTIAASINAMDVEAKVISGSLSTSMGNKYVESIVSNISANTAHTLPSSLTYTPVSTSGQAGKNMDVYVNGQLVDADTGTNGANADRDYAETSTTQITFRFNIVAPATITYFIKA